jgi:hypothetical protein
VPSSQPNYLTVDPTTGAVGAVFPGGVVIPSVSDPTPHTGPQIARTVRWMRGSDGALVADIYGYARGGATRSGIQIHAPLVSGYTTAGIIAQVGNVPPATILRYYARPTIPDIVTVNDGVTQNVGLGYCTLSTA